MKLKKGDKLVIYGFESDSSKELSKIIFETAGGNKLEFYADGENHAYHCIKTRMIEKEKFEEELEV